MKEANMQTLFGSYIKQHPPAESEAYELKICKGTSLPFSSVDTHQINALLAAETGALYHRITDQPWLPNRKYSYTLKKPFDCFVLRRVKAYVVVWFYIPRKSKVFIKIPIQKWVNEVQTSDRKSLTPTRATEIGYPIVI